MSYKVIAQKSIEFEIKFVEEVLSLSEIHSDRHLIVIDKTVNELWGNNLNNENAVILEIPSTELSKTWSISERVLHFFEENNVLRRSDPIIAIGGGVLLDLVGFCCSIYRRGIPYIRIPTTLLAIVDASVGIKTGINHFDRRNRLGSFYPPVSTLIDTAFIKTQSMREISNGVAEILKLALVSDTLLLEMLEKDPINLLESKLQNKLGEDIIHRSISTMTTMLSENLWETELARVVDFGHSFSPLIEMKNIANLLHGEAVILDCLLSSCIARNRNYITDDELQRIFKIVKIYNLPTKHDDFYNFKLTISGLMDVMKHRNNNQFLPLPNKIGHCKIVNDVTNNEIQEAIELMKKYG